ncbi:MAG TPA: bifunctional riboflavin kinase/FAD synthetase [Anaerolineae bacterium]|nr:bifunctional riboflavin kinase/FAD synthetase [Anaerolineae bacterium]
MQVFESITAAQLQGPTHLTIGNFDGMHRGHRALIATMQADAHAHGAACGLLTFHPHPRSVLHPDQPIASINSLAERLKLYAQAGLDFAIIHPFTRRTAQTEPEAFMDLLKAHLALSDLWVGPDFAMGRARRGNVAFLREYGQKIGVRVHVVPEFRWEGIPVRSSLIRQTIMRGNLEWANVWLGRFFTISGLVVHGAHRGRKLGFPTANLTISQNRVHPADGVYAAWATVENRRFPAVVNIGVRPTVNGKERLIEAHLIGFDEDIYGRCLELAFVARLRDEMKFPSLDALIAQIARDKDLASWLLSQNPHIPDYERYRELPYTADWGVEVFGTTLEELYIHAAIAMFGLQAGYDVEGPTLQQAIEVEGADREDLLVSWLSELLWQQETHGLVVQNVFIRELTETRLRALVFGRVGPSDLAHIKAVTYHDLAITPPAERGGLWRAQVLFDT